MNVLEGVVRDNWELLRRSTAKKVLNAMNSFEAGRQIIRERAEGYIGGHNLEEGLEAAADLFYAKKFYTSVDVLGEDAKTIEKADEYVSAFIQSIDWIAAHSLQNAISISLKPSAICGIRKKQIGKEEVFDGLLRPLEPTLEYIADYANKKGVNLTLDMEDSHFTNLSLAAAHYLWTQGYKNFGIAKQSRLDRDENDTQWLTKILTYQIPRNMMRVREVLGIYLENSAIASGKTEGKERLISRVGEMLDAGIYVEIATHDTEIIDRILQEVILPKMQKGTITTDSFEFQILKGVDKAYRKAKELRNQGYKARVYWPIELKRGDANPYMERRLIANPDYLWYGIKDVARELMHHSINTTREVVNTIRKRAA